MSRRRPNIAITGFAQTGKSTSAAWIRRTYGYQEVAFADALRDFTVAIDPYLPSGRTYREAIDRWGYEGAKEFEPGFRDVLKNLGNGARSILGKDVWVNAAMRRVRLGFPSVFSDCRFHNEAAAIRNFDPVTPGVILRIHRPGKGPESDFELESADIPADYIVDNSGSVTDLYNELAKAMEYLLPDPEEQLLLPLAV